LRPVAGTAARCACARAPQRGARETARDPAPARAEGLSRHARRAVSARAHGAALGKGPAEERAVTVAARGHPILLFGHARLAQSLSEPLVLLLVIRAREREWDRRKPAER